MERIENMKSQNGVTLTSLVAYVCIFMIIIAVMTVVSAYFYKNVMRVESTPKYVIEFNEFAMFFIADVKSNSEVTTNTDNSIVFGDGTRYQYKNKRIYRNGTEISKNVQSMKFTVSDYTKSGFTKRFVRIDMTIGDNKSTVQRSVDFVLKYW